MSCSYDSCDFDCYESQDKCIFHCNKSDWLTPELKHWKPKKVKEFWGEIRSKKREINNQFIGFVFPEFEKYPCELTLMHDRYGSSNHVCIDDTNFGVRSDYAHYYSYLANASFHNAAFLGTADFSRIYFTSRYAGNSSISFESVVFHKNLLFSENKLITFIFNGAEFNEQAKFSTFQINNCTFDGTRFINGADFTECSFDKINFSSSSFENDALFTSASVLGDTDFSKAHFTKEANFEEGSFGGRVTFSEAQFSGDAIFTQREFKGDADFSSGVTIKGKALFDVKNITGNAEFSEATFKKEFTFKDVNVTGISDFSKSLFQKEADFQAGSFGSNALFSEAVFGGDANFSQREFKGSANFSSGVIIKGKALFDVKSITGNAEFSEATFKKEFTFKDVNVTGISDFSKSLFQKEADFQAGSFGSNALFSEAVFDDDANFSQREFKGNADFSSGVIIKGKALFDVKNITGNAEFSEAIFKKEFTFKDVNVTGISDFSESSFQKEADFCGSVFENKSSFNSAHFNDNVLYKKCNFKNNLDFMAVKVEGLTNYSDSDFSAPINFSNGIFEDDILFNNCIFRKKCGFRNVNTKGIDFSGSAFIQAPVIEEDCLFIFYQSNCGSVNMNGVTMNFSRFAFTESNKFKELILNAVTIYKDCEFELSNTSIGYLSFDRYINKSEKVLFDFVTVTDKLKIKHVSFDKERFNHFDISKPNIEIENSAFNSNFFNSVKWGTIHSKRYTATRDIFRQLKFYSEQQKNYIDADGFYSLEMKEQKKELLKENRKLKSFPEKVNHFFTNTLVFYLHEKTSDFSQNWWLPLIWLVSIGMIGVIFKNFDLGANDTKIAISFSFISVVLGSIIALIYKYVEQKKIPKIAFNLLLITPIVLTSIKVAPDFLDDMTKLLNPINMFKEGALFEHEFVSLIYRIIVLFLVYQLITSIKKKVRSK